MDATTNTREIVDILTFKTSASLVLFNSAPEVFELAANSFLNGVDDGTLVIVDNSDAPIQHPLFEDPRVIYIFNNRNLGFGAAHNRAIDIINGKSDFHLILNPDIHFSEEVIPHLVRVMYETPEIGALMPRINYPDGSLQRLCKLLPTPVDLIMRRFIPNPSIQTAINRSYELHHLPQDRLIDVPTISGCFLLIRTEVLIRLGGFDERYFMYLEDVDLVRRIGDMARVAYDPRVSIIHNYAKGSYRSKKLLKYHIVSAVRYFAKWGWWLDADRRKRNSAMLSYIRKLHQ